MPPFPAKIDRYFLQTHEHYSRTEKVVVRIEYDLLLMVPDHVYKFQMICLKGT